MADEADLAQYYSDLLINEGLTRVRRQLEGTGLTTCKECGAHPSPASREHSWRSDLCHMPGNFRASEKSWCTSIY